MRDDRTGEFGSGASALRAIAVDEAQPMSGQIPAERLRPIDLLDDAVVHGDHRGAVPGVDVDPSTCR